MLRKTLQLPFWALSNVLKIIVTLIKLIFTIGFGTVRFISSHIFGTAFGALIGFFLGKKHLGIKVFTRKKRSGK